MLSNFKKLSLKDITALSSLSMLVVLLVTGHFLNGAKAASYSVTEDFSTIDYEDSLTTTAAWDTSGFYSYPVYLNGKTWFDLAESIYGSENVTSTSGARENGSLAFDSSNHAYEAWSNYDSESGYYQILFRKWTSGSGWTKMDGTTGHDIIFTAHSSNNANKPIVKVGSDNIPYIIWLGDIADGGEIPPVHVYFAKWTVGAGASVCGEGISDCWTDMAGTSVGDEDLTPATSVSSASLELDPANNPNVVFDDGNVNFIKWTVGAGESVCGAGVSDCWTNMAGDTAGVENITTSGMDAGSIVFKLDSNGKPNIAWSAWSGEQVFVYFVKWTSAASAWTGEDGVSAMDSFTGWSVSNLKLKLDSGNLPFLAWNNASAVLFTKWTVGAGASVCGEGISDCWTDMAGTTAGQESVNSTDSPSLGDMALDDSYPYLVWQSGARIYFTKWTPSVGWTNMAGDLGTDELNLWDSDSQDPVLVIDNAGVPYVTWKNAMGIAFAKWSIDIDPALCGGVDTDCWTDISGGFWGSGGPELLTDTADGSPSIQMDANGRPIVSWLANDDIFLVKGLKDFFASSTAQSTSYVSEADYVLSATINPISDIEDGQAIEYFLSNNGTDWEAVTPGSPHTFTSEGHNLFWRAVLSTTDLSTTPGLGALTIDYETGILSTPRRGHSASYFANTLSAPTNFSCMALSPTSIRWSFSAAGSNITGFRLYGPEGKILDSGNEAVADLDHFDETNLQPNTQYADRYATEFNGAGESSASNTTSCFTLASKPLAPLVSENSAGGWLLKLNGNDSNPRNTLYAIKDLNSGNFVQADGSLGENEGWQNYAGWGGENGLNFSPDKKVQASLSSKKISAKKVKMSLASSSYKLAVKAKNSAGVETDFSDSVLVSPASTSSGSSSSGSSSTGSTSSSGASTESSAKCEIKCSDLVLKPYIVNPNKKIIDVSNTKYAKIKKLASNKEIVYFEDKGSDFDYNDAVIGLDWSSCTKLALTLKEHDATWHHQIKVKIYYGNKLMSDAMLWPDDLSVPLNATQNFNICTLLGL